MSYAQFFSSRTYAVVGASADPSKFGNKVLRWYIDRGLDVVPVNPKADEIESIKCIRSISELADPKNTSISVITPPSVTLNVVREAQALGIPHIWIQPGGENAEVLAAAASDETSTRTIAGGPCILVSGDAALEKAHI